MSASPISLMGILPGLPEMPKSLLIITPIILQAGRDKLYLIKRIKQGMSMHVGDNGLE